MNSFHQKARLLVLVAFASLGLGSCAPASLKSKSVALKLAAELQLAGEGSVEALAQLHQRRLVVLHYYGRSN